MRTNTFVGLVIAFSLCAVAAAQTKTSGTIQCGNQLWLMHITVSFLKGDEDERESNVP